jgi:hypothetical protein
MTDDLKDGLGKASTADTLRHGLAILIGILLSRLVKHNLLTGEEVSLLLGFLPSLIFNVGYSYWRRHHERRNVEVALKMPQGSSVEELKAVLSEATPTAVISATPEKVVVVKEVEKEEK